jgi:hypothetical protein
MRTIAILGLTALLGAGASAALGGEMNRTVLHISSHLDKTARASLDGAPAVAAPGDGSVNVPTIAGHHVLKVTTSTGVVYSTPLNLAPATLMHWKGTGYWCVNLLDNSLEVYSKDDCQEEVTDAG